MDAITKQNVESIKAVAKARIPVMLVGAPGTGKTQTIKKMAEDMGYDLITLVGSRMDPTDISGLPAPSTYVDPLTGKEIIEPSTKKPIRVTEYYRPWWQVDILTKKRIILFFDEFSNTQPAVRASLLTLFQDREFADGSKMPSETIVIGAMNPVDQAADGSELDLPTKNRMFFIPWEPSPESWYDGMLKAWGKDIGERESMFRRAIVDFIKKNPEHLHREPTDIAEEGAQAYGASLDDPSEAEVFFSAWPSRRSWDNLARALAETPVKDSDRIQEKITQGLVGYQSAVAFMEFLRERAAYDPIEVLNDPDIFDWSADASVLSNVLRGIRERAVAEDYKKVASFMMRVAKEDRASEGAPHVHPIVQYLSRAERKLGIPPKEMQKYRGAIIKVYNDKGTMGAQHKQAQQKQVQV